MCLSSHFLGNGEPFPVKLCSIMNYLQRELGCSSCVQTVTTCSFLLSRNANVSLFSVQPLISPFDLQISVRQKLFLGVLHLSSRHMRREYLWRECYYPLRRYFCPNSKGDLSVFVMALPQMSNNSIVICLHPGYGPKESILRSLYGGGQRRVSKYQMSTSN